MFVVCLKLDLLILAQCVAWILFSVRSTPFPCCAKLVRCFPTLLNAFHSMVFDALSCFPMSFSMFVLYVAIAYQGLCVLVAIRVDDLPKCCSWVP